jgi:phosphohistidine phosphatase SixA
MLPLLSSLMLAAGMATATGSPPELRREELMAALRSGGYTILLRHARTDRSFNEERSYVPVERSKQRNLTVEGVRDAELMGVVFKKFQIPLGEIVASPMFRTKETAELAAGTPTLTMLLRSIPSTAEQAALVAAAPKPGTNRLLVTHHFVIETHVPGIQPGEIGESEAAVIRPSGDGTVELVGRITLADWQALAYPETKAAPAAIGTAAAPTGSPPYGHGASGATNAPANPGSAAIIPDTPAGRLLQGYLDAFNSGDAARMRGFIEASLIANPSRSTGVRLDSYVKLFEEHGPLVLTAIQSTQDAEIVVAGRSRKATFRLTLKASTEQSGRIASATFGFEGNP